MKPGSFLHIVRNSVSHDSRVLKETHALAKSGLTPRVEIAGFHEPGFALNEEREGRTIRRIKLTTRRLPKDLASQSVKYAEWYLRALANYRSCGISVIHCHDLAPLPIAVRLKHHTGAKLIYDAHELETETNGSRGLRKRLAAQVEQRLITHADAVITVSPSIKRWYTERYPKHPVEIVRNIPELPQETVEPVPLRERFNVPDDALLFIYLGGLGSGRGIERLLDAFGDPGIKHHLLFLGSGPLESRIAAVGRDCPRVHRLPPVAPDDVIRHAAGADVGLSLIEDTCLSYRYSLPNKLFECLLAGVPVLASNLPDQSELIRQNEAGWVVNPETPELVSFLSSVARADVRTKAHGLRERVAHLRWSNEAERLLKLYHELR